MLTIAWPGYPEQRLPMSFAAIASSAAAFHAGDLRRTSRGQLPLHSICDVGAFDVVQRCARSKDDAVGRCAVHECRQRISVGESGEVEINLFRRQQVANRFVVGIADAAGDDDSQVWQFGDEPLPVVLSRRAWRSA